MYQENRKQSQGQLPNISKGRMVKQSTMSNSGNRKSMGNVPFGNNNGQNYNSKEFIQNFSQKLEKHENQIEARNQIIKEMEGNIELLKREYIEEKGRGQEKEKYIQQLQGVYQQLENKYKQTNIKMEEMQTKLLHYERDNQKRSSTSSNAEKQLEIMKIQLLQEKQLIQENYEQIQKQLELKDQELFKSQKMVEELQKQINSDTTKEDLQNANLNIKDLKAQNEQLNEKLKSLEIKQKESLKKNEQKIDELTEKNNQLEKKLLQAQANSSIESSFQQKYEQTIQDLQNKLQKISDLEMKLRQSDEEKQKIIQDQKKNEMTKYEMQEKHIKEMNDMSNKLNKEMDTLKNKLQDLEERNKHLKQDLTMSQLDNQKFIKDAQNLKDKDTIIKKNIDVIDKNEKEIMKSLKCNHCTKIIKEPVTIIPCGHNFCFECKTAYTKQCIKCGPKVKIEAMYRNELLDDILGMVKIMQNTKDVLKQLTTK